MDLIGFQDSLAFPWDRWFPDSAERLVYRPKDRYTAEATRKRMDRLGGLLGATHLAPALPDARERDPEVLHHP